MTTRIGLVGTGFMAETHVDAYDGIENVEISAVASPSSAPAFVDTHGLDAATYSDPNAMLEQGDVDAVDICSPTPTHREIAETALQMGFDVFCEKPIAGNLADANALVDASNSTARLVVGHVVRFFPEYRTMRDAVAAGEIGTPGVARARRRSPFPDWGDWYADRSKSGGLLVDLAIHDFDYLRWVFGPIERVFARSDGQHAHVTLRFENGAVGYVEASWALPDSMKLTVDLELAGSAGLLEYDGDDIEPVVVATDDALTVENPLGVDGYRRELEEFVASIREDRAPSVTAEDAVEALRISLAARESVDRGEPVMVTEVEQ